MIYFMRQANGRGPIKIGHTDNPHQRLMEVQHFSPVRLQIVGIMEGGLADEKALHRAFVRYRHYGEWFRPARRLLRFIEENARPWLPTRPPIVPLSRSTIAFSLNCEPSYVTWLVSLARHCGMPLTDLMHAAIEGYARDSGYAIQPPDRGLGDPSVMKRAMTANVGTGQAVRVVASLAWLAWAADFADSHNHRLSTVFDRSLVVFGIKSRFGEQPPIRLRSGNV